MPLVSKSLKFPVLAMLCQQMRQIRKKKLCNLVPLRQLLHGRALVGGRRGAVLPAPLKARLRLGRRRRRRRGGRSLLALVTVGCADAPGTGRLWRASENPRRPENDGAIYCRKPSLLKLYCYAYNYREGLPQCFRCFFVTSRYLRCNKNIQASADRASMCSTIEK